MATLTGSQMTPATEDTNQYQIDHHRIKFINLPICVVVAVVDI
jgi:hypothetical protein